MTVGELVARLRIKGGEEFVRKFKSISDRSKKAVDNLKKSWLGLSVKITGASYAVDRFVSSYANFDNSIREIGTLLDNVTERSIVRMGRQVKKMAIEYGQSLVSMAKARYDIISAGFKRMAGSMKVLAASAKLAIGGVSTVAQTALSLTKTLNSFRLGADKAGMAADIMFTTVRLGQTTIDQLVGVLGNVTAIAHKARLGLLGLGASMAVLTAGGLSTETSAISLRGALLAISAPSESAAKAMREAGIEVRYLNDGTLDIVETMRQFQGIDLKTLSKFIPDVRAANAVAIMSDNVDKLAEAIREMRNSSGAADRAFQKMAKGAKFRIDQIKTKFSAAFTEIGKGLLPLYEVALAFLEVFADLPETLKVVVVNVAALTVAFTALRTILIAVGIATGPIGWIVAGATILAGVLGVMSSETDKAAESMDKLSDANERMARSLKKIGEETKKEAVGMTIEELQAKQKAIIDIIDKQARIQENTRARMKNAATDNSKKFYEKAIQAGENYIALKRRELSEITQILNDRKQRLKKEQEEETGQEQEFLNRQKELQFQFGEISLREYTDYLRSRLSALDKHSTEYLDIYYEIKRLEKEADDAALRDKEESESRRLQLERAWMAQRFSLGKIGSDQYLNFLRERLSQTERFSAEYLALWGEIQRIEQSRTKQHLDNLRNMYRQTAGEIRGAVGNILGAMLNDIRDKTQGMRNFWKTLLVEILDYIERKFVLAKLNSLIEAALTGGASLAKDIPLLATAAGALEAAKAFISSYAEGGVVTRPTLALLGDRVIAGRVEPEIVAPQQKFEQFASRLLGTGATEGSTRRTEVIVNQNFNTPLQDKRMAQKMTDEVLRPQMTRALKRGGRFINRDPFTER